jgi:hypothetical protein
MNTTLIAILAVIIIVTLISRDIALWYFKINYRAKQNDQIIKLLTEIRDNQKKSNGIFISEEK